MLSDLSSLSPDVVILGGTEDILDRCRVCHEVRTLRPDAKVLTLSDKQKDDDLYEIILSGASGDVLKAAGSVEIVRSVGVVACGGLNFDNDALIRLLGRIPRQGKISGSSEIGSLTEREIAVLSLLAHGCKNKEISKSLSISDSTVKSDIAKIKSKLLLESRTELAMYAVGHGLVDVQKGRKA